MVLLLPSVISGEDTVEVCSDADYNMELTYLKQKVDAGADFILTQMVFDAKVSTTASHIGLCPWYLHHLLFPVAGIFLPCIFQLFENFVKACRAININVPIIPGIMCVINYRRQVIVVAVGSTNPIKF